MAAAVNIITTCVDIIGKVANLIYERIKLMKSNNIFSRSILKKVEDLKKFSVELKNVDEKDTSEVVREKLTEVRDTLELITAKCNSLQANGTIKCMTFVSSEANELEDLDKQVQHALDCLQTALQLATYNQGKQIKEEVKRENQEVRNTVYHSKAGVYLNPKGSRPKVVTDLKASLIREGDLVEISWVDENVVDENVVGEIDHYELCFDDGTEKILPLPAKEINTRGKKYFVRIGEPHVVPGNLYTFKLRAVNGSGPGNFGKSFSFRFKTGSPARPKKPNVIVTSTTEVRIEVKKLTPQEEHGSPVTHCVVEYTEMKEYNEVECQWTALTVVLKKRSQDLDTHNFSISSLKPNTTYRFRVKMRNESGDGVASESKEVITDCLIPGPPQNVRISRKRLATVLKVRWSKPSHNPYGVSQYKVQYRLPRDTEWIQYASTPPTKFSTKVTDLKTDTEYEFRIQALNQNNKGETSNPITGETRFGAFGRALLTAGAGIGGTVGGPLVGGVVVGHIASSTAEKSADSLSGKRAASAAAGIGGGIAGALLGVIGAPLIGITSAINANQKLKGNFDSSPQTSDDEKDEDWFDKLMKHSNEAAAEYIEKNTKKRTY